MPVIAGIHALLSLCEALGIDPKQGITKIVIEVPIDGVAQIYVRSCLNGAVLPQVADWCRLIRVEDVQVTDRAEVVVTKKGA